MNTKIIEDIKKIIEEKKSEFITLSHDIWANPELGFEEKFACARQTELLNNLDFDVVSPFAGLDTAYKASFNKGGPVFGFAAEYDALPDLGHACGHNLICSAAIAAGWALSSIIKNENIEGSVVILGTPAEESKGGKVIMLENNALEGIDAIIMAHPSWRTVEDTGSTAIRRFDITFNGKSAHASASPELGINALDAVLTVFNSVNAWRQHMPETSRVHGIIVDGGVVPNIVPDFARCQFFLRATDDSYLDIMEEKFKNIIHGACMITGATSDIKPMGNPYKSRKANKVLNKEYFEITKELGMNPVVPKRLARGSSDFGDFSHAIPGIHAYFGISTEEISAHSIKFADAANSDYAMEQMLKAACAMAYIGYNYISNKTFRDNVADAFNMI